MNVPHPVSRRASSTRLIGLPIHWEVWAIRDARIAYHTAGIVKAPVGDPIVMRQRWWIAAALFAVVFSASSPIAAFGVFLPTLADAFGWSRGAISVALSITLLL